MPEQLELKLDVSADGIETLKREPSARRWLKGSGVERGLAFVYLDTRDLALHRQGLSFRLSQDGDQAIQTIKGPRRGVLERAETETPYSVGDREHPVAIEALLQQLSDRKIPTALRPVFKIRIERTSYRVRGMNVSLDKGRIVSGHRSAPLCEIELELKGGDRTALFTLARRISNIVPAEISLKAKSERGYDLITRSKPGAIVATETMLWPSITVAEAFQTVCNSCLCQLIANKAGVRASASEAFHQMRVALTRLDAAMKLFSGIASGLQPDHLAKELKWLRDELTPARDIDVLLTDVLVPLKKRHPADVEAFYHACLKHKDKEYERVHAALASARFRMLLLAAAEWIEAGQWQRETKDNSRLKHKHSARKLVADRLSTFRKKLEEGRHIEEMDPRSLHKFRLRAKRMRYSMEFSEGLFDDKQNRKRFAGALASLKSLQSALGLLNDIAVQKAIFDRVAVERVNQHNSSQKSARSRVARLVFGNQDRRIRKLLKESVEAYQEFEHTRPFWT